VREPDAVGGGDAVNRDQYKDLPEFRVEISPNPPRWLGNLMHSDECTFMRNGAAAATIPAKRAMAGKTSFMEFAPSGVEMAVAAHLRIETASRRERLAGAAYHTVMLDSLSPTYLADLWLRGLLSRECLDDMSEAELVSMRTRFKNRTLALCVPSTVGEWLVDCKLAAPDAGEHAAQRLDELTAYMRRRFPRRGSTPPCEAVCV